MMMSVVVPWVHIDPLDWAIALRHLWWIGEILHMHTIVYLSVLFVHVLKEATRWLDNNLEWGKPKRLVNLL